MNHVENSIVAERQCLKDWIIQPKSVIKSERLGAKNEKDEEMEEEWGDYIKVIDIFSVKL